MKGIILAGGTGSRLYPITKVVNKQLLPVYDRPMIFFPLFTLIESGIKDIMIVTNPGSLKGFKEVLGNGEDFEVKINYALQHGAGGIADALSKAKGFCGESKFAVILGDNIIEENISEAVESFKGQEKGAMVFLKEVEKPQAYGVAEIKNDLIVDIEEKPAAPKSNLAAIGCYFYDAEVFKVIEKMEPSARGEMEITDVNNYYIAENDLHYHVLEGYWQDCGESFESFFQASEYVRNSKMMRRHSGMIEKVIARMKSVV